MKSMHKTGLAVLVMLLSVSAVSASSAFAITPEWEAKTGGVYKKLVSPLEVKGTGEVTVYAKSGVYLPCTITFRAKLEAGGLGKVVEYAGYVCNGGGHCGFARDSAVNIPWNTQLYQSGTAYYEKFLSGGSGEPEWHFECTVGGFTEKIACAIPPVRVANRSPNVLLVWAVPDGEVYCGTWRGEILIKPPAGVEAIRAVAKP